MAEQLLNDKPDFVYIKKTLRRQAVPAIVMGLLIFTAGMFIALNTQNIYRSSISVVLDPRDLASDPFSGKAWANATQRNFRIKFQSQEFIQKIITEANIQEDVTLKDRLSAWFGKTREPAQKSSDERNISLIRALTNAINAENERDDGALSLTVDWKSPDEAQRIASHAMDLWILSEIEDELAMAKRRLDGLLANAAAGGTDNEATRATQTQHGRAPDAQPAASQRIENLSRDIAQISEQISIRNNELRRKRVDLEVDLERLRSKFLPTHPDIKLRESELSGLARAGMSHDELSRELESKRSELIRLRTQSGLPTTGPIGGYIESPLVTTNINHLQNYIGLLERQLTNPSLRARFNIIKSATYETAALRRKKFTVAVFSAALAAMMALFTIIYREANNNLARDAWRVELFTKLPVWGQISSDAIKKHPKISVEEADTMRERLGQNQSYDEYSRTLLGYRRIEIAIRRRCAGRIVALIEGSDKSDLRGFYTSLINIMASDMSGKLLFIDANHINPMFPSADHGGFLDLIANFDWSKNAWDHLIQRSELTGKPYDYISSGPAPKGLKTRLYSDTQLQIVLNELTNLYNLVIIRGLPETHFIENSALATASSDTLMIVDSSTTSIPQITRSIDQLGESPIRGLVLVGT